MKILTAIIAIIIIVVLSLFVYCAMVLNAYMNENGLRYHWFDEEGENDGETDTR